jgi:hypothetical protein
MTQHNSIDQELNRFASELLQSSLQESDVMVNLERMRNALDEQILKLQSRPDFDTDLNAKKAYQTLKTFKKKVLPYIRADLDKRIESIFHLDDTGELKLTLEAREELMKLLLP